MSWCRGQQSHFILRRLRLRLAKKFKLKFCAVFVRPSRKILELYLKVDHNPFFILFQFSIHILSFNSRINRAVHKASLNKQILNHRNKMSCPSPVDMTETTVITRCSRQTSKIYFDTAQIFIKISPQFREYYLNRYFKCSHILFSFHDLIHVKVLLILCC